MQKNHENVILFPKWQTMLEDKSLQAMKRKEYDEALCNLNQLLSYQVMNHEIITGKLICLMELGRYDEARDVCEQVLEHKDKNYYHYLHMYLTILFQTSEYELLMETAGEALTNGNIPLAVKEQFEQLYDMSEQMHLDVKNEKQTEYIEGLHQAIQNGDHVRQWRQIENIRKLNIRPPKTMAALLADKTIHPVTKTALFEWFRQAGITEEVAVNKLNYAKVFFPARTAALESDISVKQTTLLINEIEQDNPSLYQMLKQLLARFAYVRYPIMFPEEDVIHIAQALKQIGNDYLQLSPPTEEPPGEIAAQYIEEIRLCEALYLAIIEQ